MPEMENAASQEAEETLSDALSKAFDEAENKELGKDVEEKSTEAPNEAVEHQVEKTATPPADSKEVAENSDIEAPQSWGAAVKEEWRNLPEKVRKEIQKREEEIHKGFTKADEDRTFGKSLKDVIQPYMPMIAAEGGNPVTAVRDLLNTSYRLRSGTPQQKGELIMQLAKHFGAELPQQNSSADVYVDPTVQTLQQRVNSMEAQRQQEIAQQQYQQQAHIQQTISAFAADPAHPHYETVRADMAALIGQGRASSLQDAYEKATWAHPEIRSTLLAKQQADLEAKRLAETKQKTAAARNAAVSVTGGPGMSIPKKTEIQRDLREDLSANYDAITQGGSRI